MVLPASMEPAQRPRRYGWILLLLAPVVGSIVGIGWYGQSTNWYFLLPGVPSIERLGKNPALLRPLAEAVGVPVPTDLSTASPQELTAWYEVYSGLRQMPTDAILVDRLASLFDGRGDTARAAACRRRVAELRAAAKR